MRPFEQVDKIGAIIGYEQNRLIQKEEQEGCQCKRYNMKKNPHISMKTLERRPSSLFGRGTIVNICHKTTAKRRSH
ncbi:hypothetical protein [Pseudolabrys sp. FHR47]|uniref:hypothetical protein n=1 Tax=Pseudolabrys sp. FHR47 TaxID=2562284 RepID=UPI0010BE62D8|nr:hypothetical protein [Pseudolabrys sp. FHR47]